MGSRHVVFEEKQRLPLVWVLLTPATAALIVVIVLLTEEEVAWAELAIPFLAPLLVVVWLGWVRLQVRVTRDTLVVHYRGLFKKKQIPISSIGKAEMRRYRPLREYGGWGIKKGRSGWAYNTQGNEGVQLHLHGGKKLLIGSQRAAELEAAILSSPRYRPERSPT